MIITITLNPAIDRTITLDEIHYGEVNRVERARLDAAGKGIDVAKVVSGLGEEVICMGFLGSKNKAIFEDLFEKMGIKDECVHIHDFTRVNTVIVEKKTTNFNEKGFFVSKHKKDEFMESLSHNVGDGNIFVMSGSAPEGIEKEIYREIIENLKDCCKVFLDADGELLAEGVKAGPFLIKPNLFELNHTFGYNVANLEEGIECCTHIIEEYGITYVLLSAGGEGCALVSKDHAYIARPLPVVVKSTTGAGDSLLGGFVYELHRTGNEVSALKYGTACAALAVSDEGTGVPELSRVQELIKEVEVWSKLDKKFI